MHPSQLAARRQVAESRIDAAISQLAERAGVEVPTQDPVRDRGARDLFRLEALATAIELIAASLSPETSSTPSPDSSQGEPRLDEGESGELTEAVSDLTIAQLTEEIGAVEDLDELRALLDEERAGKDRRGAIAAIEARIAEIEGG